MEITLSKINSTDKEHLCKQYLEANGHHIDSKFWFPIVGTYTDGKFAAYIITHWKSSYEKGITNSFNLDEYSKLIFFFDGLPPTSFITWKENTILNKEKLNIINFDLNEIINEINSDETLRKQITKSIWKRKIMAFLRPLGVVVILLFMLYLLSKFQNEKPQSITIKDKITNVETAIDNIRSIESDLKIIEQNLNEQLSQAENIEQEYDQVQLLKKLTKEEIEAFRIANDIDRKKSNWTDNIISFALGVFASIAAYYIIELIKYWKK